MTEELESIQKAIKSQHRTFWFVWSFMLLYVAIDSIGMAIFHGFWCVLILFTMEQFIKMEIKLKNE